MIIPSFHRCIIKKGGDKADLLIKLYLSAFSLNRTLAPKVSKSTFKSMIDPIDPVTLDRVTMYCTMIRQSMRTFVDRYLPDLRNTPLEQGLRFEPTWKSLPTKDIVHAVLEQRRKIATKVSRKINSIYVSLPFELACFADLVEFTNSKGEQWCQGTLWAPRIRYPFDENNKIFSGEDLDWFQDRIGPLLPKSRDLSVPPSWGRLSCSFPGAGKRRCHLQLR